MIIYDLQNGGKCEGLFLSLEGAKARAREVLESYREFDGDPNTEAVDYDAEWVMQRETIARHHEVGKPKPTLNYGSSGGRFVIREREVHE